MNNKKKLLAVGASVLGCAAVGFGAYAFFIDDDSVVTSTKVGTVDLTVTGELLHEDAYGDSIAILNPGDNDPESPEDSRPGTDHELSITYTNNGNKSVITRAIVTVSATDVNGDPVDVTELDEILIGLNNEATGIGDTVTLEGKQNIELIPFEHHYKPGLMGSTAVYIIGGEYMSPYILSGVGEDAEIELDINGDAYPNSQNLTFEIGLDSYVESDSNLYGATVNINVEIQAMQYRNTGSGQWDSLFADSYEVRIPN